MWGFPLHCRFQARVKEEGRKKIVTFRLKLNGKCDYECLIFVSSSLLQLNHERSYKLLLVLEFLDFASPFLSSVFLPLLGKLSVGFNLESLSLYVLALIKYDDY